jgi:hypothetical protein
MKLLIHLSLLLLLWPSLLPAQTAPVVPPKKGESRNLTMFDGKSIDGWLGDEQVWSIENAELVGRGSDDADVKTQLVTEVPFSDFRLTIEFKLTSGARAGVGFWKVASPTDSSEQSDIDGHTVWFAPKYAIANAGRVVHDASAKADAAHDAEDWNKVEILAQGNRIRIALNGYPISDWRDPQPDSIETGPITINFESSSVEQTVRFRKLHLETFPAESKLVTLGIDQRIAEVIPGPLNLEVGPGETDLWSKNSKIVIPRDLLDPFIDSEHGLKTMGIRPVESNPFHAILEKARIVNLKQLKAGAREFRDARRNAKGNEEYLDREPRKFPSFVDLYHNPREYHGKPVTLKGHIRKLIRIPAADNPYGIGEYFEAWLYDPNSQNHPTIILATSIDKELIKLQGADIEVDHVMATGYFVKNMGYEAQDTFRFAPLLIAQQLELARQVEADPFALTDSAQWVLIAFGVLLVFWARFFWRMRKQSLIDDADREVVREIVDRQKPEPTFDGLAETDAAPDFSAYGESDKS